MTKYKSHVSLALYFNVKQSVTPLIYLNSVFAAPPRITLYVGPTYVERGDNATLPKCHVTGHPEPRIRWSKHGKKLREGSSDDDGGRLILLNAKMTDLGHYSCEASNALGSASALTLLTVVEPLRFVSKPPEVINVTLGENISFNCAAEGHRPVTTWSRENGQVPLVRSFVFPNGTLAIWTVEMVDAGRYVCTASSRGISKSVTTFVRLNIGKWPKTTWIVEFRSRYHFVYLRRYNEILCIHALVGPLYDEVTVWLYFKVA